MIIDKQVPVLQTVEEVVQVPVPTIVTEERNIPRSREEMLVITWVGLPHRFSGRSDVTDTLTHMWLILLGQNALIVLVH